MTTEREHTENDHVSQLIKNYRENGNRKTLEPILTLHDKILHHIVRRYTEGASGESYEDLLQVGYVGLIKAVNDYKFDSPAKFSSYAYARIDGELQHHFRDTGLVKRPRWARSLYSKISKASTRLTVELGRPPLLEEIAEDVNVSPEGVAQVMKMFSEAYVSSIDEERGGEEGSSFSVIKSLQYESFSLPIEDRILLEQGLESLSELQQRIVYLFFYKDLSQTEIGRRLGLPQRKISLIIASAVKNLSKKMRS